MGILKHFVLPVCCLMHIMMIKVCLVDENLVELGSASSDSGRRDMDKVPMTSMEIIMMHSIGSTHCALLVNNLYAFIMGTARQHAALETTIMAVYSGVDAGALLLKDGNTDLTPPLVIFGICIV